MDRSTIKSPSSCPPDLVTALDAVTDAQGMDSRSAVIRLACRSYLKRAEKRLGKME